MAGNENLNGNNNNNNQLIPIRTTAVECTLLGQGLTESDATHIRLRDDQHPTDIVTCLSCGELFASKSQLEIIAHYSEQEHTGYFGDCLYCRGKVHQYRYARNNSIHIYHDCLRWKRGEDK